MSVSADTIPDDAATPEAGQTGSSPSSALDASSGADAAAPAASDASTSAPPPSATTSVASSAGWPDAPAGGQNAAVQTVAGMQRVPICGLTTVNADPAADPRAVESAAGRAIALIPAGFDATLPVEVLLHLHGFNIGYRQRTASAGNTDPGSVRDILQDQIAAQVAASGRTTIVLLPQGTLHSGFGPGAAGLNCSAFVTEALTQLAANGALGAIPAVSRTILSAHSGGGGAVALMLGEAGQPRLPAPLEALFLFEAINGTSELAAARTWLSAALGADLTALQGLASDDERAGYLGKSLRFRGYYHAQDDFYVPFYTGLQASLDGWFAANAAALGGTTGAAYAALRANYQISVPASFAGHDKIVGANLGDALTSLPAA